MTQSTPILVPELSFRVALNWAEMAKLLHLCTNQSLDVSIHSKYIALSKRAPLHFMKKLAVGDCLLIVFKELETQNLLLERDLSGVSHCPLLLTP
jgi:hypothetical protein